MPGSAATRVVSQPCSRERLFRSVRYNITSTSSRNYTTLNIPFRGHDKPLQNTIFTNLRAPRPQSSLANNINPIEALQTPHQSRTFSSKEKSSKSPRNDPQNTGGDDSNLFLDNIGKVFLGAIATVVLLLVRSSKGTTNRENKRIEVETKSLLDPLEIDDLRLANEEFSEDVFRTIYKNVRDAFPSKDAVRYLDFVSVVVQTMRELFGEEYTVQFGHLIDRVIIGVMEKDGGVGDDDNVGDVINDRTEDELPLSFLFAVLSLALNSPVSLRVELLYNVLNDRGGIDDGNASTAIVLKDDIVKMVDYLQKSCQLPSGAQILETQEKYPIQTYKVGTAKELVAKAHDDLIEVGRHVPEEGKGYSLEDFNNLLRSSYICAWGECYGPNSLKKK
eukprot:CAMPEP_0172510436 /NCGR_PEP_ID=MMETSP1066-20121228/228407_1 /TAXON_ID=671091 /ORGANISM="Coscinodiscus wailesii, Strain CCMP2513" /LENGTH=389 /DNA_ID=CAMNT_0013289365 /DNA_START=63 /DNA_END=1232 /DNA_ORIENTATION=+